MITAAPQKSLKDPEFRQNRKVLLGLTALNIIIYLTLLRNYAISDVAVYNYNCYNYIRFRISAWVLVADTSDRSSSARVNNKNETLLISGDTCVL